MVAEELIETSHDQVSFLRSPRDLYRTNKPLNFHDRPFGATCKMEGQILLSAILASTSQPTTIKIHHTPACVTISLQPKNWFKDAATKMFVANRTCGPLQTCFTPWTSAIDGIITPPNAAKKIVSVASLTILLAMYSAGISASGRLILWRRADSLTEG